MACLVVLLALLSPRLAIIITWLFTSVLDRAFDSWLLPVIGFFILPWTTLAYAWLYDSGRTVTGIEWLFVVFAFLLDIGSYGWSNRARGT